MTITRQQSRAARALLEWSQVDLARAAGMSKSTVTDFESGKRTPIPNNMDAIRAAFEAAGIEFIHENGGGLGLRHRERG